MSLATSACAAAVPHNQTVEEETEAFLKQFGYLSAQSRTFSLNSYDNAVRKMQKYAGIPVTGKLDDATKKVLTAPRCGFTDKAESGKFVFGGSKWSKNSLTYRLENFSKELGEAATRRIIARAFKYWSDVTPLTFTEIGSRGDLNLKFQAGRHYNTWKYCLSNFDGKGKVLAHAFHPEDGRVHFDEDEYFTDGTYQGTNLLWVATHELGHALGLKHSPVKGALMFAYYTGYQKNFYLPAQDVRDIQEVYGKPSGGGGSCTNLDADCPKYPKTYCACSHEHFKWMTTNCPKHCGLCGTGGLEDCKNLDADCPKYPKTYCASGHEHYKWITTNCPKHCGLCTGCGSCTDKNSSCSGWADKGECQKNPGWMLVNCKKSCKQC